MIYISHLLPDEEMQELLKSSELGVESIEFSISENLDHLDKTIETYKERLVKMGNPPLTLHGPFLDLIPATFDSMIRRVTMERFEQCYQVGKLLGSKKNRISFRNDPCSILPSGLGESGESVL